MSDEQTYGGVTDPDALAWLQRNYPAKPKADNTRAETGEEQATREHHVKNRDTHNFGH
jgi:hypothetical protein